MKKPKKASTSPKLVFFLSLMVVFHIYIYYIYTLSIFLRAKPLYSKSQSLVAKPLVIIVSGGFDRRGWFFQAV